MRTKTLFLTLSLLLLGSSIVWATTSNGITVDGKLGDFAADEKLPADSSSDSIFGINNELTLAYLTWDANNLYLGFDFKAWGTAVMYLLDLNGSTGATSFCPSAGYNGAFPANFKTGSGTNVDLMVALYVPNKAATSLSPFVYKLTAKNSTDITTSLAKQPMVTFTSDTTKQIHSGSVEVALPWNTLFGLGAGKVPKCAKLGLVGVLRGQYDKSALGDANPDNALGDKSHNCDTTNSKMSTIAKWHTVDLDKSCDGVPDKDWMPGSNKAKVQAPDAGAPDQGSVPDQAVTPDQGSAADQAVTPDQASGADQAVTPDQASGADQAVTPDQASSADQAAADKGAGDNGAAGDKGAGDKGAANKDTGRADSWGEDSGYHKPSNTDEGCACSASGQESLAMGLLSMGGLLAMAFIPGWRRRRR